MLKKATFILLGIIIVFIVGSAIMVPINVWYADLFLGGEDHTGQVAKFNMFLLWPLFIIAGFFIGNYFFKKFQTLQSRKQ